LADTLRLFGLRRDEALDLDLELTGLPVEADIALCGIVAALAVVKPILGSDDWNAGPES
jgi:hypothetical protein